MFRQQNARQNRNIDLCLNIGTTNKATENSPNFKCFGMKKLT